MENLRAFVEQSLSFWYLAGQVSGKHMFWNTNLGRITLALLPGVITAVLTAGATVGSLYLSMRDDMLTIRQNLQQMNIEHSTFRQEQTTQDGRLNGLEKDVSRIKGVLEVTQRVPHDLKN